MNTAMFGMALATLVVGISWMMDIYARDLIDTRWRQDINERSGQLRATALIFWMMFGLAYILTVVADFMEH